MKIKTQSDIPQDIIDEIEKLKPSSDPVYWAKKGCKDCCGRGIVGVQKYTIEGNNTVATSLLCSCVRKKYKAWVDKTVEGIREGRRSQQSSENKTETSGNSNGKKDKERNLRTRLATLEEAINIARIEIAREDTEINSHPHYETLGQIKIREMDFDSELNKITDSVQNLEKKITDLTERSQRLDTAAKSLARDAHLLSIEKDLLVRNHLAEKTAQLREIQAEYRTVEKDLNSKTHKAKRRRRLVEDKLSKLLERRSRVIQEAGFDPATFSEFMVVEHELDSSNPQV